MKEGKAPVFIESNDIKATNNRYLVWCILFMSFGYQYKLIFCGGLGLGLGQTWICYTIIGGISTNHWFEHLIYVPLVWVVLNATNNVVFGPGENEVLSKSLRRKKWVGQLLALIFIYGCGMHITNTVEIFAREQHGITSGPVYDQIYWIDEHFSHIVQFFCFFSLIAWFVAHDRLDRHQAPIIAIVCGVIHGVDRGIGVIEGDNYLLGIFLDLIIVAAWIYRWHRHDRDFWRSWQDFFFRHAFIFTITFLSILVFYSFFFGLESQPSNMGMGAWKVIVLALSVIAVEIVMVVIFDRVVQQKIKNSKQ